MGSFVPLHGFMELSNSIHPALLTMGACAVSFSFCVVACSFDWDALEPSLGGGAPVAGSGGVAASGGGGSTTTTSSSTGGSTGGSTSSGGGGAGGGGSTTIIETAGPGLGLAIPPNGYDGSLSPASCACVDLAVATSHTSVLATEVEVGIDSPYLGQLTIKVQSGAGTITTLVSRAGFLEAEDNGQTPGTTDGDNSDLDADFSIRFRDGEPVSAEDMGATIGDTEAACRDDSICAYAPNPGAGPGTALADFAGENPNGTWRVCVGDGYDQDTPSIDMVELALTVQ